MYDPQRHHRPIRKASLPYGMCLMDPQQETPAGWCPNCGGEIYAIGQNLCNRCAQAASDDAE